MIMPCAIETIAASRQYWTKNLESIAGKESRGHDKSIAVRLSFMRQSDK